MANVFNTGTHAKIQGVVNALSAALGLDFNFKLSKGFRIMLSVNPDGQSIAVESVAADQGPNNATSDTGGNPVLGKPVVLPAVSLP